MKYTYNNKRIQCFDPDTMKPRTMTLSCMKCGVFAGMIEYTNAISDEIYPFIELEVEEHDNDETNERLGNC